MGAPIKPFISVFFVLFFSTNASALRQIECPTMDEIQAHVDNNQHAAEAFCMHKVLDPAERIPDAKFLNPGARLPEGTELAFSNYEVSFDAAVEKCSELGNAWHAPFTYRIGVPETKDFTHSVDAVQVYVCGKYQSPLDYVFFWSGSRHEEKPDSAWGVRLRGDTDDAATFYLGSTNYVVCAKFPTGHNE